MIQSFDERREIAIPGSKEQTIQFCVDHFIETANSSIRDHGFFTVALAGGSTPKAIYQGLAQYPDRIDWKKVWLFWGDERCVPPTHQDSNYKMAMDAAFSKLPVPSDQIFRMQAEKDPEHHASSYESLIKKHVPNESFDLVMLGMGEDGHTASLFPQTHALHSGSKLAVANFIPEKELWRMTLTYHCINQAQHIAIYVLGKSKAETVSTVFTSEYDPDTYPIQRIGTPEHKALWILDQEAAGLLE